MRKLFSVTPSLTAIIFFVLPLTTYGATVRIEIEGDLTQTIGADVYNLAGAHFFSVFQYDTTTPARLIIESPELGEVIAAYSADLDATSITDRPNGADDYNFIGSGAVFVRNGYPPIGTFDSLARIADDLVGDLDGLLLGPAFFRLDVEFIAGELAPELPVFDESDVEFVRYPNLRDGPVDTLYELESPVYTVSVVPIPAAAWLFGSALGLLGWLTRRKS